MNCEFLTDLHHGKLNTGTIYDEEISKTIQSLLNYLLHARQLYTNPFGLVVACSFAKRERLTMSGCRLINNNNTLDVKRCNALGNLLIVLFNPVNL